MAKQLVHEMYNRHQITSTPTDAKSSLDAAGVRYATGGTNGTLAEADRSSDATGVRNATGGRDDRKVATDQRSNTN